MGWPSISSSAAPAHSVGRFQSNDSAGPPVTSQSTTAVHRTWLASIARSLRTETPTFDRGEFHWTRPSPPGFSTR